MAEPISGKKLGILLSTSPERPDLQTVVKLSQAAVSQGVEVYLYLLDDGILHLNHPGIDELLAGGVKLFCCAYAAQKRNIPRSDKAVFGGLFVLLNLLNTCDQFIAFN
ncbi:MAG: DsrE family protein [Gemmatimonadota bacterium]|nr:MAG: DsrE family protein [Gemmatimonadota bacterium]